MDTESSSSLKVVELLPPADCYTARVFSSCCFAVFLPTVLLKLFYIYIYVCVCVYVYIYIYLCACACACVYTCYCGWEEKLCQIESSAPLAPECLLSAILMPPKKKAHHTAHHAVKHCSVTSFPIQKWPGTRQPLQIVVGEGRQGLSNSVISSTGT